MDKFFSANGVTFGTMTSFALTFGASLFPILCIFFNIILCAVAVLNRKNNTFPLAYVIVMSINGIVISLFVWFHCVIYLVLTESYYDKYLITFGRETTLFATYSYLNYLLVCVLMTVNRIFAVAMPFSEIFTNARIFLFCALISVVTLISLVIPYFSPCFITFNVRKLAFVSGCAPDRHPITWFQNYYSFLLPITCMVINLGIIFHVKWTRNKWTEKIKKLFSGKISPNPSGSLTTLHNDSMSKLQAKRERDMMRQTIIVAFYLSIYEFGGLAVRFFPEYFAMLPVEVREAYFYLRLESIPAMNIIIYYSQTGNTRRMIQKFMGWRVEAVGTSAKKTSHKSTTVAPVPLTATNNIKPRSPSPVE